MNVKTKRKEEPGIRLHNEAAPIKAAGFARLTIPYWEYPYALADGRAVTQRFG